MTLRWLIRRLPAALLVVFGAAWMCSPASAQEPPHRTVLVVHWSSEDYPSTPVIDAAIRAELRSRVGAPVDYFAEYLESDRFPDEEASLAFRDYLRRKYRGRRIDALLAITDPALTFVRQHREELFPDAPIVMAISSSPDAGMQRAGAGLTGVAWRAADAETIELALKLHPSTERVFVVAQATGGEYLSGVQAALARFAPRVDLVYLNEPLLPKLIADIRAVPPRSVVLFIRHAQQDPGDVLFPQDVVRRVAEASPVPVYVSTDSFVGTGAVGGVVRMAQALGARVGQIASQVLDGRRAADIPIEQIPAQPIFDWNQLRRWGIAEASLPAASLIRFREVSMWQRYRIEMLVAVGLLLAQSGLIVALLVERRTRRRAQVALRESEELTEIAGVSLGVGFWTWDPEGDRVWTTKQCAWLLGAEPGTPMTLDRFLDALRPQIAGVAQNPLERAIKEGAAFDGEWPVTLDNGEVRWIAAATRPSADSPGRRYVTGVLLDVTARKTAERQAEEHRRHLSHLGRVAMLGEMSGAIAHELRQPLMAIRAYAQGSLRLIGGKRPALSKVQEALEEIVRAEKHAGEVIDRARSFLKRGEARPEALGVNDIVRETLALASVELHSRNIIVITRLASSLPRVVGDRIELQQVLMNVVLNACDAMTAIAPPRQLTVSTALDQQQIRILVSDAGTGIPADRLERIFDPFETTKPGGLGLGLAICRSILLAHGGDIRASNNLDRGCTVQISLPVAASPLSQTHHAPEIDVERMSS
jgi:signal transduction histidine kinase